MSSPVPRIDWRNHLIGLVVVVIGILMAFQLNQCSANRRDRRTIAIHQEQIRQETLENKFFIQAAVALSQENLLRIDTLMDLIRQRGDLDRINRLSMDLLLIGGLYTRKNAYTALIESGDIQLMDDFAEKQRIINLYEYYKWVESYSQIALESYQNDFYPYVKTHMDLAYNTVQAPEVYYAQLYLNALSTYRYMSRNKLARYKDCLTEIDQFLEEYASQMPKEALK